MSRASSVGPLAGRSISPLLNTAGPRYQESTTALKLVKEDKKKSIHNRIHLVGSIFSLFSVKLSYPNVHGNPLNEFSTIETSKMVVY